MFVQPEQLFHSFSGVSSYMCHAIVLRAERIDLQLKLASKWLITVGLVLVALSALILASTKAAVSNVKAEKEKTDALFSIIRDSNATVAEIFRQFKADGKTIPQASLEEYGQALALVEESRRLLQAGNYSAADSKIIDALQKFREALRIVYATFPEQPTEPEIALEKTVQLKSSIDRYYDQLARIENLTGLASAAGYNTTVLETKVQATKSFLESASRNVNLPSFDAASENLAEAKFLIDRIAGFFNNFASDLKIERIAMYINQTQDRLNAIRIQATSLSNTASLAALTNAETSLINAKEYLTEQQISETLTELANSKASEEEAVEYLKSTASSFLPNSSTSANAIRSP
jgi:hypothetical protein